MLQTDSWKVHIFVTSAIIQTKATFNRVSKNKTHDYSLIFCLLQLLANGGLVSEIIFLPNVDTYHDKKRIIIKCSKMGYEVHFAIFLYFWKFTVLKDTTDNMRYIFNNL